MQGLIDFLLSVTKNISCTVSAQRPIKSKQYPFLRSSWSLQRDILTNVVYAAKLNKREIKLMEHTCESK